MLKLKIIIALLFLCVTSLSAQKSINDYKYIIVPIQYDFQKGEDLHQLNSLTKFLFNKAEFQAYLSNENFPDDLRMNRCLALTAKLNNNSKMLSTRMNFDLVNCDNTVVFSSIEARSKEKDYKKAYHECIRESFEDIKAQNYTYTEQSIAALATSTIAVKEKVKETPEVSTNSSLENATKSDSKVAVPVIAPVAIVGESSSIATEVVPEKPVATNVLYAQPTTTGFQLVDSTPKVIYTLQKTSVNDVYLVKGISGIVYKANGIWKVDYYENGKLISKELNLKFF